MSKTPRIFKLNGDTYRVKQKDMYQTKFKDTCAYLLSKYNDYVYPYRGEIYDVLEAWQVGLYLYEGRPYVVRPVTDEDKYLYSKKNIIDLTLDCIFKDLNGVNPSIGEAPILAETDGDIFKPTIRPTDDIALAGMKFAIGQKNINFNTYANRFADPATKNNGRRALTYGNSLKMDMLSRFAEVFDVNAAVLYWDKQNCTNPMDPDYNTVYYICDTDDIDLTDKKTNFVQIYKDY